MIASGTVLIEYEIFDPEKGAIKVAVSKLRLVYYISGIQIHLLSTRQILQSVLRVEGNKSVSLFIISLVMLSYQLPQPLGQYPDC